VDTLGKAYMGVMERRKRRAFTDEFKAETVRLVLEGGKTVAEVARDLDLTESAVRVWVHQAKVDRGQGKPDELTTAEREELQQLRREVKALRLEREILKKAAAFFAKENG
jgi:transposase